MPKQDFLWEAALAHRSAALAWDALVQREAAAAAAAAVLVRRPAKAPPLALGPPAPPPPPKALQDLQGPLEPLAAGAVFKAYLKPRVPPKAPVQASEMPAIAAVAAQAEAPKAVRRKIGRKSSHVRKRPPEEYSYDTSQYYTSESDEPAEPAAGAVAEGSLDPGPGVGPVAELSAKPGPGEAHAGREREKEYGWGSRYVADGRGFRDVRLSTLRERQPKKPRVRRTRKRRSSPHRRRKKTHPKGGRSLRRQEEYQRGRSASKSCYRPGEYRARAHEAKSGRGRERPPSVAGPRGNVPEQRGRRGSRSQGSAPRQGDAIRPARVRSLSRGGEQIGAAGSSGRDAEPGVGICDDYIVYQGNKNGTGIGLRLSMDLRDVHPVDCVAWGMLVRGRELPGGWLEVPSGGYLPMDIEGTRQVVPACLHEPVWSPPRGSRRRSSARSSGLAAKLGPRQQVGGKQGRQDPEVAVRRAEPEDGGGTRPEGAPYEVLRKLFCKYDDAYFREAMPERLGPGWQELSPRQLKRQVCKHRKSQFRWRFAVEGGFRDYVLQRMPEKVWRQQRAGLQEGFWQTFHYGGQPPEEADDSSPERSKSRGRGILRSRPRSRPRSNRRRIAGLSPSGDEEL